MKDDFELVRAYLETGCEAAFAQLVDRHKGLVYASALRQTGDRQLAEEITQAVFVVLARKAAALKPGVILSGWLFRATRFAAADALKRERRRQRRQHEISLMNSDDSPSPLTEEAAWQQISPALDESLARLAESDRHALLLRFFEQKPLADVGHTLGLSEDAARKRVQRALEKLRTLLSRRGVVVPVTVLAATLAANAAPAAPGTLVVTAAASIAPLVKGTLALMAWSNAKIAVVAVGALLLASGGAIVTVSVIRHARSAPPEPAIARLPSSLAPPAPIPDEVVSPPYEETPPDAEGFVSLFNGRDLSGWTYNPYVWSARDGALSGRLPPEIPRSLYCISWTGAPVDDFELRLRFRVNCNSGVGVRARWAQQRYLPGYQAELDAERTGKLIIAGAGRERQLCRLGWRTVAGEENGVDVLNSEEQLASDSEVAGALRTNDWNDYVIIAQGTHFVIRLNGVTMMDTRDEHPSKFVARGVLGFEYTHRQGQEDFAEFKDIRFKRLLAEKTVRR